MSHQAVRLRAELRGCTTNHIKLEAKQWARDAISGPLVVSQAKNAVVNPPLGFMQNVR